MSKTIIILTENTEKEPRIPGAIAASGACVLQWARRCGLQDRAVLIHHDPILIEEARRMGFRTIESNPSATVRTCVKQVAEEMEAERVIYAYLPMPFREDWLVEAVEAAMDAHPGEIVRTCVLDEEGTLFDCILEGLPANNENAGRRGGAAVPVYHHAECLTFINKMNDLLGARYWRDMASEIGRYPRWVTLRGRVAVVGSSGSIAGSGAGREIDACDEVVRIHDAAGSAEDYGTLGGYIFGYDPERINAATDRWTEAKIVSSVWPMPSILRTVSQLSVTPSILNSARWTTGNRDYVSTGMAAVFWALACGADRVSLAGFGGRDHRGAIKDDFDKIWVDAENAALDRMAGEGLVEWLD